MLEDFMPLSDLFDTNLKPESINRSNDNNFDSFYLTDKERYLLLEMVRKERGQIDLTLPGFSYMGPGTKFVTNIHEGKQPINNTDDIAKRHDYSYTMNPGYVDKFNADIRAIGEGLRTPVSGIGDFFSRIALVGGLGLKAASFTSPIALISHYAAKDEDLSEAEKQVIVKLYNGYKAIPPNYTKVDGSNPEQPLL